MTEIMLVICAAHIKMMQALFSWTVSVHSFVLSHSSMVQSAVFVLAQQRGGRTEERKSSRFIMYIHLH